jgi:zinc/manganese transport system substrate-binding protein
MSSCWRLPALLLLPALTAATACGGSDGASDLGRPTVVVTTNVLGDVVANLLGDGADVTVVMPVGASPHDFQASARQAAAMRDADLLVVNGGGFEEGLLPVIEGAEEDGVPVIEALSAVDALGDDPHFFTDPSRMADAARAILAAVLDEIPELDRDAVRRDAAGYLEQLDGLATEVGTIVDRVPEDRRVLVTNHEVFAYFADAFGFEVVGTVIPGATTSEGPAAGDLAALLELIRREKVPAIFADTSSPTKLADALARDGGGIDVVELYSESLGAPGSDGATYLEMIRTNAERIVEALT